MGDICISNRYDKICRTCLKGEKNVSRLTPIFGDSTVFSQIPEELSLMRLKLTKDDGFPQSICNECVDCLMYISSFRKLCEKSQTTLERNNKSEKVASIEVVTRNDLEFAIVEFLHDVQDEHSVDGKMEIQFIQENQLADETVLESSDDWNQSNLIKSKIKSKDIQNKLKCPYCDNIFESIKLRNIHIQGAHPTLKNRTHVCPICGKYFATAQNRNIHIESHNKNCVYKCDICDSEFKCKNYLAKHKRAIHTVGEHECPHCFLKFNNNNKYKYHLKTHDPNKKYKCKYCEKSFLQQHHLSNHERVHTGVRPYLCNICGKDFRQEHNFTLHLRTHSGHRPYVCTLCGKDFVQRGSYLLHKRQHAGVRPYQCEHCGKNFYQKSSLNVHLRTHTGERPFKCDLCNKSFVQSPQLKYHKIAVHATLTTIRKKCKNAEKKDKTDSATIGKLASEIIKAGNRNNLELPIKQESAEVEETPAKNFLFKCSLCVKTFKLPSSLASHLKIHSEERKHVCTECGNTFKRAEHLRVHINGVHLKQKPYSCEICHKTFSQAGDRNIHLLAHTGEKPHSCPHCSKRFRLQKALKAHVRIHTGEKPYKCEICKMGFITYNALVVHTVKHPDSLLSLAKENCLSQYAKLDS